jgi:flagellum-specific ATP synthase
MTKRLRRLSSLLRQVDPIRTRGRVTKMVGLMAEAVGPAMPLGSLCTIQVNHHEVPAEVVGFQDNLALLMPLDDPSGIHVGAWVESWGQRLSARVGMDLLGRVLNGLGEPIDDRGPLVTDEEYPLDNAAPDPLTRKRIQAPLPLGIRAIDGVLTCGQGQRVGIFAGSGVGKSTVLGMIARNTAADVNVIALIGERTREVLEFIERDLGEEGLKRSVVVVVTGGEYNLLRVKGALLAMSVAEYFRDQGLDVLFMMDSLTRLAMAQREIGVSAGEPPTSRGYPPSAFTLFQRLLERAGTSQVGTITALCTVLVDADDFNEPISDHSRSILDGHVMLTRNLAAKGHYPAIDVGHSVSRVMPDIVSEEHGQAARQLRETLATYLEAEDLINIGAYKRRSNPKIDFAIDKIDGVNDFLRQGIYEKSRYEETQERLLGLFPISGQRSGSGG